MAFSIRKFLGLKGDTKKESADYYINKLDDQVREDMVEVSANLMRLQDEIKQFKETIDKMSAQLPGQKKI
jgi:Tfp pilus assembly protein PilO